MIRFDSDYLEGCLPEILKKLSDTNLEQTLGYSTDPHCENARALIREACGAPKAEVHFLVGGTQTNATVISFLLKPWQGVVCAHTGHIAVHETGAIEHSGHKVLTLPGTNGKITADQIEELVAAHRADESNNHSVEPAMVYISFSTELGTIYSLSELKAISKVCRKFKTPLFIDGARLGYGLSSPECDVTLKDIASLADVFYIGGTKQGALFGEVVVFTNTALAEGFRYAIKMNGGLLAKGRLLGIQFETLFTDGLYFRAAAGAVQRALRIRDGFRAAGYDLYTDSSTNQQFIVLPNSLIERLRRDFSFLDWAPAGDCFTAVRFCTSWATTDAQVDALLSAL